MMKSFTKFLIASILINIISCELVCSGENNPPQEITIDSSKTINPISFKDKSYNSVNAGNIIFLTENTKEDLNYITTGEYSNSDYCPEDFIIPYKTDFEKAITNLGSNAYSFFTDENGLNMQVGKHYLTNTIVPDEKNYFKKVMLYLEDNTIKFIEETPSQAVVRCMLKIPNINIIAPFTYRDLELNERISVKINDKYLNGLLWKIDETVFTTANAEYTFTKSKEHKLEFWGKYINGDDVYFCDMIYVNKEPVACSQSFDDSKIKVIETNFSMPYSYSLHFQHSNFPIAPRDDGGYYIAISNTDKILHVLSYDKDDNLKEDFDTKQRAYPHDITATDDGFAIYMLEADSSYHSYLSLYNNEFELVKTVQIMNNNENDDKTVDSNLEKQIIKYDSDGNPVFGMRFMYRPDNGKLLFSRGRIFLIFAHYNYFLDSGGHTGDTVVTFDEKLSDMDFGITWGASHSLIQSATYNEGYFWTAALSDAYPEGIKVEYTSKRNFTSSYDPINEKYNSRVTGSNNELAGYIKGYQNGRADGKLGGILFFEKYELYCLVYAKTPNYSEDNPSKNNKPIIFITTWKFEEEKIKDSKTYEIKVFNTGNLMQLRAGKYGEDKIIIIYAETNQEGNNGYGNIPKGTKPRLFVVSVSNMKTLVNDKAYDNLLMNTNEDLRTFRNGVLIWGGANKDGNLVIHKIGDPSGISDETNDSHIFSGIFVLLIMQFLMALEFLL